MIKKLELGTVEPLHEVITAGLESGVFADTDPDLSAHDLMLFAHGWALKHWYLRTAIRSMPMSSGNLQLYCALFCQRRAGTNTRSTYGRSECRSVRVSWRGR
jgi:hypothetical protein